MIESDHPELYETRDNLGLTVLFNHIRDSDHASLICQLDDDPRCVVHIDSFGATPLHWAAGFANVDAIATLLAAGADVDARDLRGWSVLFWAIDSRSTRACKAILKAGADVHARDLDGYEALLHCCLANVSGEIFELLLRNGCDPRVENKGRLALSYAACFSSPMVCNFLLALGVDIDSRDALGETPLCCAIRDNRHPNVQLLIDRGASMVSLDDDGDSIIVFAALWADITTMDILQNACIDGLYMSDDMIKYYWGCFDDRDAYFVGERAPVEEERAAFQALLDSIIPCSDPPPPRHARILNVPGAFPSDAVSVSDSSGHFDREAESEEEGQDKQM